MHRDHSALPALLPTALALCLLSLLPGCATVEPVPYVDLDMGQPAGEVPTPAAQGVLRVAVSATLTGREGLFWHRKLLDHLTQATGLRAEFVEPRTYSELDSMLRGGAVDIAFSCAGPYVQGHDEAGIELLAVPEIQGERVFRSYLIVGSDSAVRDLEGLRGKRFAFVDPGSHTGWLLPTMLLLERGHRADSFFSGTVFTYAHERSIDVVADGLMDGAAVDSLVWEDVRRSSPELAARTRVVWRSGPYGIPPVVVRPDLDSGTKELARGALVHLHETRAGRTILDGLGLDRFVLGDDADYDGVRKARAFVRSRLGSE